MQDSTLFLILFFTYTLSMPLIFWFGLPFKKKVANFTKQDVSHSIIKKEYTEVRVYSQFYTEANIITVLGLIGLFFIVFLVHTEKQLEIIPFIFCSAVILSDWLDGKACIKHDCHSKFGAILDPARDRFAILVLIFTLLKVTSFDSLTIFMLSVMLLIEIGIAFDSFKHWSEHKEVLTHHTGKMRQATHLTGIFFVFLFAFLFDFIPLQTVVYTTLSVMIVASMLHYNKILGLENNADA